MVIYNPANGLRRQILKIQMPTTSAKIPIPKRILFANKKAKTIAIRVIIRKPTQLLSFSSRKFLWKKEYKKFEEADLFRIFPKN